jgi:hypothetical protein
MDGKHHRSQNQGMVNLVLINKAGALPPPLLKRHPMKRIILALCAVLCLASLAFGEPFNDVFTQDFVPNPRLSQVNSSMTGTITFIRAPQWNATYTYAIGNYVEINSVMYIATAASTNEEPPNASYWSVQSTGINMSGWLAILVNPTAASYYYYNSATTATYPLAANSDNRAIFVQNPYINSVTIVFGSATASVQVMN